VAVLVSIAITGPTGTASSAHGRSRLYAGSVISRGKAETPLICQTITHCVRRCFELLISVAASENAMTNATTRIELNLSGESATFVFT